MAGFEELIRDTLARQGEPTHANRARVYASARSTLERMIARNEAAGVSDPDGAQVQRESLEAAIERVEDEHASRLSAGAEHGSNVEPMRDEPVHEQVFEPEPVPADEPLSAPPPEPLVAERSAQPPVAAPIPPAREPRTERRDAKRAAKLLDGRPKRRPFAKLLLWAIILAGLASAGWWAWTFGPDFTDSFGPVPNPVQLDVPSESGAVDGDWITVFDPRADIASVATGEAASSRIVEDGSRSWLRLASSADPDIGPAGLVRLAVPPGIMRSLAGRRATFEATVRAAPGVAAHPFSVVCEFANGSCNRTRFDARSNADSFLFVAELGESDEAGTLVFDTDLDDLGRAIDLGAVRVSVQ